MASKAYYTVTFDEYSKVLVEVQRSTVKDVWESAINQYATKPDVVVVALSAYEAQVTSATSLTFRAVRKRMIAGTKSTTMATPLTEQDAPRAVVAAERIIRDHALGRDT